MYIIILIEGGLYMFFDKNSDAAKYMDKPDRFSSDGKHAGYDDKDTKTTTWYNKDGTLDCQTKTPND